MTDPALSQPAGERSRRFAAGGVDPNDLAMTLALALPMAWYLGTRTARRSCVWICRGLPPGRHPRDRAHRVARRHAREHRRAHASCRSRMTKLSPERLVTTMAMLFLAGALAVVYVPEKIVAAPRDDLHRGGGPAASAAGSSSGRPGWTPCRSIRSWASAPRASSGRSPPSWDRTPRWRTTRSSRCWWSRGSSGCRLYLLMFLAVFRGIQAAAAARATIRPGAPRHAVVAMLPLTWEEQKPVWFVLAALVGLAQARLRVGAPPGRAARPGSGRAAARSGRPSRRRPPAASPPGPETA